MQEVCRCGSYKPPLRFFIGMMIRLDKLISDSGLYSRSEAIMLIRSGRVSVDSRVVTLNSEKIDPNVMTIKIDNKPFVYKKYHYLMMNKPQGFVSSTLDKKERTVIELLDERYNNIGLFPAGRLDKDAEGFLLLTNDGELSHKIASPNCKVEKRYFVEFEGEISDDDILAFESGLKLNDGMVCLPAKLERAENGAYVTLREGKFHQVKKMMAAIGKPVKYLKRVAIGKLVLDESLEPGQYRELGKEIGLLFD